MYSHSTSYSRGTSFLPFIAFIVIYIYIVVLCGTELTAVRLPRLEGAQPVAGPLLTSEIIQLIEGRGLEENCKFICQNDHQSLC